MDDRKLNEIKLNMSIEQFEKQIQEYYLNLDNSITGVKVNYFKKEIPGQYDNFWQRNLGGYVNANVNVEITRNITACSEDKTIKNKFTLEENELMNIFSTLLEKEDLNLKSLRPDIFNKENIIFYCSKKEKKQDKSSNQLQKNISPKTKNNAKKTYKSNSTFKLTKKLVQTTNLFILILFDKVFVLSLIQVHSPNIFYLIWNITFHTPFS